MAKYAWDRDPGQRGNGRFVDVVVGALAACARLNGQPSEVDGRVGGKDRYRDLPVFILTRNVV
ncbi:hypothetical protein MAPG_08793 [Magnaporthiopsis poae ATCC 64411]|uniref:Uncharacterized protein n=1 Tax=Magnaporthiopsis poae (strain ATCC 64411 / 73-15) TaxID=644358 RepID=A0A0C4E896_MAGP6|nr:hypothetical protein MAPG_08793 [Magnaporthiopsis poae ATCC 64411]